MNGMRQTDTHVYFVGSIYSQWYPAKFKAKILFGSDEEEFCCCEQYMMASKAVLMGDFATHKLIMQATPNPDEMEKILSLIRTDYRAGMKEFKPVPALHKKLGRDVKPFDPDIWDEENDDIVFRANWAKFTQNDHLLGEMLMTEKRHFVEGAEYDQVWGVGLYYTDPAIEDKANWRGQNKLGKALDRVKRAVFDRSSLFLPLV